METTRVPEDRCPSCAAPIDSHSCTRGAYRPRPGDFSVCARCCAALMFGPGLRVQLVDQPTIEKMDSATLHHLRAAQALIAGYRSI